MRQTGRTSRIIDFVIDQLYSVGEVVATDHAVYEHPYANTMSTVKDFVRRVKNRVADSMGKAVEERMFNYEIFKIEDKYHVHFRLKVKEKPEPRFSDQEFASFLDVVLAAEEEFGYLEVEEQPIQPGDQMSERFSYRDADGHLINVVAYGPAGCVIDNEGKITSVTIKGFARLLAGE